jgi:hypothetical protein
MEIPITCKGSKLVAIEDLIDFQGNLKTLEEREYKKIRASIEKHGFSFPVFVWEDKILDGHQRICTVKRMLDEGFAIGDIPVVEIDAENDAEAAEKLLLINSRFARISEDGLAEFIESNSVYLKDLVGTVDLPGIDMLHFVDEFFGDGATDTAGGISDGENDLPPVTPDPETRIGDVWVMGENRLLCGDSCDRDLVQGFIGKNKMDCVVFDPPYDVPGAWGCWYDCDSAIVFSDYKYAKNAIKKLDHYSSIYHFVWDGVTSWYTPNRPLARHKSAFVGSMDQFWDFEKAIYSDGKNREAKVVSNSRGECNYKPLPNGGVHLQTVFQKPNTQIDGEHKHAKPVEWVRALILGVAPKFGIVDLFGGSGTTMIAAEGVCPCYMVEIDPVFCDVIKNRWENFTKGTAVLDRASLS